MQDGEFPDLECGEPGEDRHEQENRSPDGEAGQSTGSRSVYRKQVNPHVAGKANGSRSGKAGQATGSRSVHRYQVSL